MKGKKPGFQGKTPFPVNVKVVYSSEGSSGLQEAYRLLAKKLLEASSRCKQQSM
ncbi:glucose-6-phosphate 1-dehydrogenase [Moorella thermoacetica Y72]|uniref:Glucose-6-phosphate 1-dehydrogenase n=1 Tax=Moorella thermoacetica Y72 TaxID=1325331 RepID=A0A0S6UGR0_NEOTH|nr:glucose-6-phosphate 1-dehydrogenase [Moorella thermoacetica Y72]